ncbi:type IV secretory pathway TrbL component [Leifsonia sp. AK011]|uniref:hypothetical protein n=1 Tax=Leifsonia sp. AK011 TaxID=2723075 RepID=UPI0015C90E76|nr:hypothetical protein [Leifsonia sp. AK011]NYF11191.1 type IV secretory pathway TrbL component [Leifsonia sp. AK011]
MNDKVTVPAAPSGAPAPAAPNGSPSTNPGWNALGRFTWGALVAVVALVVLGAVFTILVYNSDTGADLATAFAAIATPVVAIGSAYFGIQVAGKAAEGANASATSANAAATSAGSAATTAADAAMSASNAANTAATRSDEVINLAMQSNPEFFSAKAK